MPAIEKNFSFWNLQYDWSQRGEEWSQSWGGSLPQWQISIFPRIMSFLPVNNLLEIAPGMGRWTRFLLNYCNNYFGFDVSQKAIEECRSRFFFNRNTHFIKNNGNDLPGIKDNSIDFVFSMDSLVHAEIDAIEPYIAEISRILSEVGVGFLHHSNLAEFNGKNVPNAHMRATSISADIFLNLLKKKQLGNYCPRKN